MVCESLPLAVRASDMLCGACSCVDLAKDVVCNKMVYMQMKQMVIMIQIIYCYPSLSLLLLLLVQAFSLLDYDTLSFACVHLLIRALFILAICHKRMYRHIVSIVSFPTFTSLLLSQLSLISVLAPT